MLIQDFLERCAARLPDKVALVCGDGRLTYGQLEKRANSLAHRLQAQGLGRGDRVAVYLNNSPQAVVGFFAALKAGGVCVAVNRAVKPDKLIAIINDSRAAALITDTRAIQGLGGRLPGEAASLLSVVAGDEDFLPAAPAGPPRRQNIDLDLACLIYTSGTNGEPKAVMCDHGSMVFVTDAIARYLKSAEQDIVLSVLPLAFSYGLYQLMTTFYVGGTLVLEESFAFPELVLERIERERVTGMAGVPTIYSRLLRMDVSSRDFSALRYLTNAAAGLPVEHVKRLREAFPKTELYLMHGLTEAARTMYLPPEQVDARPASSGIAIPGTELWIEDEEGRRLGPGQVGELVIRGRHVMRGYWGAAEATDQRFRPGPLPGERVCRSGDLFRVDEEGFFYFVSRKDDLIKSRGEKVSPREVEDVLYALQGVTDAAVIGVPDPEWGQVVKAFIVAPEAGLTEDAVISHCKRHLEEFMVPRAVNFRSELPKTGSGKTRKVDLN